MNDDIISLSDETYYHGSAVLLGDPSYMKIIVENSFDIPFWQDFLNSFVPDKNIDITPYEYSDGKHGLTDGKAHIYRMSKEGRLGPHYLGCVDADYDYLLGSHTHDGQTLQESKYLIHTFAYSVENLLCCPKGFDQVCTQACKCQCSYPFEQWMNGLAEAVFPLLVWALYLDSRDDGHEVFSATDWSRVFPHSMSYTQSDTAPKEIEEEIKRIVSEMIAEIESKVTAKDVVKKQSLEVELVTNKALTPHDSLLFVRGHDLYSFVRDVILRPVCQSEKGKHLVMIDATARDENERINRRNQYCKQVHDPEIDIQSNYCYKKALPLVFDGMKDLYDRSQNCF